MDGALAKLRLVLLLTAAPLIIRFTRGRIAALVFAATMLRMIGRQEEVLQSSVWWLQVAVDALPFGLTALTIWRLGPPITKERRT